MKTYIILSFCLITGAGIKLYQYEQAYKFESIHGEKLEKVLEKKRNGDSDAEEFKKETLKNWMDGHIYHYKKIS